MSDQTTTTETVDQLTAWVKRNGGPDLVWCFTRKGDAVEVRCDGFAIHDEHRDDGAVIWRHHDSGVEVWARIVDDRIAVDLRRHHGMWRPVEICEGVEVERRTIESDEAGRKRHTFETSDGKARVTAWLDPSMPLGIGRSTSTGSGVAEGVLLTIREGQAVFVWRRGLNRFQFQEFTW